MDSTNKTLYIPLYGKALVSRKGIILEDTKAEEIWEKEAFLLKGKARSKWLAYYMAMRRRVFDDIVRDRCRQLPDAVVLHIGCGMDSRAHRMNVDNRWYDMDFADVIRARKQYFSENEKYRMIVADATKPQEWLHNFTKGSTAIIVMEGVTMYIEKPLLENMLCQVQKHFSQVIFIADFYTTFGVKMSRIKNPVKAVGASVTGGMDSGSELEINNGIKVVKEWDMSPERLINRLKGSEKAIFRKLFAGSFAKKIYKMYEYDITQV